MTDVAYDPVEIRHEKGARRLVVTWEDGHVSTFGLDYLRWKTECPALGIGVTRNRDHGTLGEMLKTTLRGVCRRLMPSLWL